MSDLVLIARDAEAAVVADLAAQYAARGIDAGVSTTVALPRPSRPFARVRLMGGSARWINTGALLTVDCWAPTETAAYDFAALTQGLIESMPDRVGPCSGTTDVGALANQPDPDSTTPRYVFTKMIYLRKLVLS